MPLIRALEQAVTPNITADNSNQMPGTLFFNTATAMRPDATLAQRLLWLSSERFTRVHALTPLWSPFASRARIFELTTDLASSPYQRRHTLAYMSAASCSVINMKAPYATLTGAAL
jgi:hypothetical protein